MKARLPQGMGGGAGNMQTMIRQAQKMQEEMEKTQEELNAKEFPCLTYTRDLKDWHDFVRRTPDEYEAWIKRTSKECEILELRILEKLHKEGKPVFVDTNVSIETLREISDEKHVLIMLADPEISVNLFFNRPDKEKQFLYRLMMEEEHGL